MKLKPCNISVICIRSFPARGTWIEIVAFKLKEQCKGVVPREGNVD